MQIQVAIRRAIGLCLAALCGCMPGMMGSQGPSQTFTGTLHSVHSLQGGEPTGWILNIGPEGMGTGMTVDVSKVKQQAMQLDGRQVTAQVHADNNGNWVVDSFGVISSSQP